MHTEIQANAYCVGDDVRALDIMPTRFKSSTALGDAELARATFADLDPGFADKALAGTYRIVVAGHNFGGGGKTVEGPVFALRGAGIQVVVAESFARYFLRNAINNGFAILVCQGITKAVQTGDPLHVDLRNCTVRNLASGVQLNATPLSATALEILRVGGLVEYARRKLAARAAAAAA